MKGLEAVRDLLPWWALWGPLVLYVPLVLLLALLGTWVGVRLASPDLGGNLPSSWVERARLVYPGRVVALRCSQLGPVLCGVVPLVLGGWLCPVPPAVVALLAGLASYLGTTVVRYRVNRPFLPPTTGLATWLRGELVFWLVFSGWLIIFGLVGAGLYGRSGLSPWLVLGLGLVLLLFYGWGGGILVARALGLARPPSARLQAIIDQAAIATGFRPRAVYEVDLNSANALAFPFLGRLAFSPTLLAAVNDDELRAVAVHEIGHLAEPRVLASTRVLPLLLMLPVVGFSPLIDQLGLMAFLGAALAALLALNLAQPLSRMLERRADRLAHEHEGEVGAYAGALARIAETDLSPLVLEGRGGNHPHLYDRLLEAGISPTHPRPRPPSRIRLQLGLAVGLALALLPVTGIVLARVRALHNDLALFGYVALGGGQAGDLEDLGRARAAAGNHEAAVLFFQAHAEVDPSSVAAPANQALSLARLNRCQEAGQAVLEAQRRFEAKGSPRSSFSLLQRAWQAILDCQDDEPSDRSVLRQTSSSRASPR